MAMRLAMKVVQEWCRLGDQNVVSQRWEPGAVAEKFVATIIGEMVPCSGLSPIHNIEPSIQAFVPLLRGTLQGEVVFPSFLLALGRLVCYEE